MQENLYIPESKSYHSQYLLAQSLQKKPYCFNLLNTFSVYCFISKFPALLYPSLYYTRSACTSITSTMSICKRFMTCLKLEASTSIPLYSRFFHT